MYINDLHGPSPELCQHQLDLTTGDANPARAQLGQDPGGQVSSFASNASDPASDRRPDQLPIGFGTTALSPAAWRWRGCPGLPPARCLTRLELSNQGAKVPAMHSAQELLELPCQTH